MTAAVYRAGSLLADRKTGFFAALFLTVSHFIFLLASGAQFTDHNDLAFLFYITMSIWSWIEYESRGGKKSRYVFLVLTGVFAGGAVLVKWLPGLLVFAGWGLMILLERERRAKIRSYMEILFGLLACAIVFLPWQIYTLSVFPAETLHEFRYAAEHYTSALDGHTGDGLGWRYYLAGLQVVYKIGLVFWLLMIPLLFMVVPRKKLALALIFMVVLFYLFFTLGATKMPAYVFPVAGIFFLILASGFRVADSFLEMIIPVRFPKILLVASMLLWLSAYFLELNTTLMVYYPVKTERNNPINQRSAYAGFFREFGSVMPKEDQKNTVILNCPVDYCPSMMFYTDLKAVYPFRDEQSYLRLKGVPGVKVVYMDVGDAPVPEYILRDTSVTRIFVPPYLDKYYR
jgi:4-amino-4-deoxy-L-arabinose transferase-like glycosyltransferase